MPHVILLGSDPGLAQRVQRLAGHQTTVLDRGRMDELAHLDGLHSLLSSKNGYLADVVILGPELPVAESLSLAEAIAASFPAIQLVLVAEPDTDLVLRAMRSGVRDIVPGAIGEDELQALLDRVGTNAISRVNSRTEGLAPPTRDKHRVIVVAAPKGGVGKSTIATNLAAALAKDAPMETVLVDLDLQFGNVGTLLDLVPLHTIDDAFESSAASDTLILKTFLTVHPSGFYVLCGAVSPTLSENIAVDQVKHLLQQLSSQFQHIVVDTASGVDEITLTAIGAATDLVLVSSMDGTSASAVRKEMALLKKLDIIPSSRHILLNLADRRSGMDVRQVEAAIGMPVEVVVPRSLDVPVAANHGQTVMETRARGGVGKAIRHLVTRLRADEELEMANKHRGIEVA